MYALRHHRKELNETVQALLKELVGSIDPAIVASIFVAQLSVDERQTGEFSTDPFGFVWIRPRAASLAHGQQDAVDSNTSLLVKAIVQAEADSVVQAIFTRLLEEHMQMDWAAAIDLEKYYSVFFVDVIIRMTDLKYV